MTCPQQDALYRYPWPGQSAVEREALRAHCAGCEACSQVVARLESARRVLVEEAPEFAPFRQQATWRAIEAQTSQVGWRSARRWLGAAAAVTAAVLALVITETSSPEGYVLVQGAVRGVQVHGQVPLGRALIVRSDAVIEARDLRIEALSGLNLSIEPQDFLRITQGKLQIELRSPASLRGLRVHTPHVELSALGAQFTVEVGTQTQVRVATGHLQVQPEHGPPLKLGPQQSWTSPEPSSAPSPQTPSPRQELTRARALVRHDAAGARRLARAVLSGPVAGPEEVDALAVIADAHRRSGEPEEAADYYGQVAVHPAGASYAEEALLRRARMLLQVRDFEGALRALATARQRFSPGDLQPERCAAQAQVWLTRGRALRAAEVIEACPGTSLAVQDVRRDIARAIKTEK